MAVELSASTLTEQIDALGRQIAQASARLGEGGTSSAALQGEIATKSALRDTLVSERDAELARQRERDAELARYKQQEQRQAIRDLTRGIATQVATAVKSDEEARHREMAGIVQEELREALGLEGIMDIRGAVKGDVESMVLGTLEQYRSGRRTPLEVSPREAEEAARQQYGGTPVTAQAGAKAYGVQPNRGTGYLGGEAPGVVTQRGEKGGFRTFMTALAMKDTAAIADMQRASGMPVQGRKALTEGGGAGSGVSGPAGGYLVPPEYSTDLIELLRARTVLRRSGAVIRPMTSPQYLQPRLSGAASASYVGEAVAFPVSQQTFDQITLNAKKLTAFVPISNELLRDSNPSAEDTIRNDVAAVIALKEDITFLNATGSSTVPQGILSRGDIQITNAVGANGDAASFAMLLGLVFSLEAANLPAVNRVWVMHPRMLQALINVRDANQRPLFTNLFDVQNTTLLPGGDRVPSLFGYPVMTTTQIPLGTTGTGNTSLIALVEMSEVLIGQMTDMIMDASSEASFFDGTNTISAYQSDLTVFRAIIRHDINLIHPAAVTVYKGVVYM